MREAVAARVPTRHCFRCAGAAWRHVEHRSRSGQSVEFPQGDIIQQAAARHGCAEASGCVARAADVRLTPLVLPHRALRGAGTLSTLPAGTRLGCRQPSAVINRWNTDGKDAFRCRAMCGSSTVRQGGGRGALGEIRAHADPALSTGTDRPGAGPGEPDVPRLVRASVRPRGLGRRAADFATQ
jgi:hypothetical protein